MKIFRMMILPVLLAVHGVVWAGFDEGLAAAYAGDYATALREWRPLAEQGDASAQFNLGVMYYKGEGVLQDYKESVKWYRKAAEQGNADAQFNLGVMYYVGEGVPQDSKEAAMWYRKAAEQGNADAQFNLCNKYYKGEGVPQDYVQSHKWCNIIGANGDEEGTRKRDFLAQRMTTTQVAEAQRLAREWVEKHP
jgi:TPR repeat protein